VKMSGEVAGNGDSQMEFVYTFNQIALQFDEYWWRCLLARYRYSLDFTGVEPEPFTWEAITHSSKVVGHSCFVSSAGYTPQVNDIISIFRKVSLIGDRGGWKIPSNALEVHQKWHCKVGMWSHRLPQTVIDLWGNCRTSLAVDLQLQL